MTYWVLNIQEHESCHPRTLGHTEADCTSCTGKETRIKSLIVNLYSHLVSMDVNFSVTFQTLRKGVIKGTNNSWSVNDDCLKWLDISHCHHHISLVSSVFNSERQTLIIGSRQKLCLYKLFWGIFTCEFFCICLHKLRPNYSPGTRSHLEIYNKSRSLCPWLYPSWFWLLSQLLHCVTPDGE